MTTKPKSEGDVKKKPREWQRDVLNLVPRKARLSDGHGDFFAESAPFFQILQSLLDIKLRVDCHWCDESSIFVKSHCSPV